MPDKPSKRLVPADLRPAWSESQRFVPQRFVQPVLRYMRTETAGGVIMLVAAILALIWANSPAHEAYTRFWETHLTLNVGEWLHLEHDLREWVNDALMVVFFFVVGLEIKRELVVGELSDPKAAAMPIIAALGGMIVPALIYFSFNAGTEAVKGWGIPMATDIAFAVGVVSLVGKRVPIAAKLFLLALAVVDDLGAILVIAIFYTDDLAPLWLLGAFVGLALVVLMRRLEIRYTPLYVVVGFVVWLCFLESGVHATLAGVALGLLTPTDPFYRADDYAPAARTLIDRIEEYAGDPHRPEDRHTTERIQALLRDVDRLSVESTSPLERLEHKLAPWASYVVIPVFAFANAGVRLVGGGVEGGFTDPIVLGVFLGLLVGKFVGVLSASWLAVKLRLGRLPTGATWRHIAGLSMLAGIGFTVALFVTALSFDSPERADAAKVGIFAASLLAGVIGYAFLRLAPDRTSELDDETELAAVRTGPGTT